MNTRLELKEECNYILESQKQMKFKNMFKEMDEFFIPQVFKELSNFKVLTTEMIEGHSIDYIAENYS